MPASTTVITRDQIGSSGARTVQEILSRIAGSMFFDQVGNNIQTTFDLRGFTGGGITVLLDGVRLNDPRNNSVPLETIALDGVERIEITRGAAAATVGGGSAAGIVSIMTRAGGPAGLHPYGGWAAGSFGSSHLSVGLSGGSGSSPAPTESPAATARGTGPGEPPVESRSGEDGTPAVARTGADWFVSAVRDRTDGFRENGDASLDRYAASFGYGLEGGSRLSATLHAAQDSIGAPGALTPDEWNRDPSAAPYNQHDNSDVTYRQAALNWHGPAGRPLSFAGNISFLARDSRSLTTGRAAAAGSGGFLLDAKIRTLAGALQATTSLAAGGVAHTLTFGGEGAAGTSLADACGTSAADLSACDPASLYNSSNRTRRDDAALFVQDSADLGRHVTLLAGGRWDRTLFAYDEDLPDPANRGDRTFSNLSWKGGIAWNPRAAAGIYASYGESFLPPTVEDLFAFPTFGSNPALVPSDTRSFELGVRGALAARPSSQGAFGRSLEYTVSVFLSRLTNEIVFDPGSSLGPYGANVNAGRSERRGLEIIGTARIFRWLSWSLAGAWTQATFTNGQDKGHDIPLVPRYRVSQRLDASLPGGLRAGLGLTQVGSQTLSNDDANAQPHLAGYQVLDLRLAWGAPRGGPGAIPGFSGRLEVFVEANNILDESYATRGIYAWNFSPSNPASEVFVTPAPPRSFSGGLTLSF